MSSDWIARAEAALRGETAEGIDLLPAAGAPVLDLRGRRALLAPLMAGFLWAAVVFREGLSDPLDPLALLLRLLALAATLRALVALALLASRVRELLRRRRYALALSEDGLLLRTPRADYAVPREDVVGVVESGAAQDRGGPRWADVYVVTRPDSGRLHLSIPPFFAHSPGVLAERLMRWRGVPASGSARAPAEPTELPSKLFDLAAAGEALRGVSVIQHGRGWLRRGPYATVLLGAALLEGLLRSAPEKRAQLGAVAPLVIGLCLLVVPALWIALTRRAMAPRRGIALLMTPAELLLRTRAGVQRVRWSQVSRLQIASRTAWSIVYGAHESRSLIIERKGDDPISYAEPFLAIPPEVVVVLGEAYRKGDLP
jgi:hypothetical protein